MVGLVPGFLAQVISGKIGVAGAVLLGFLALSALTLVTFAWHPLQRLEAGKADGRTGGQGEPIVLQGEKRKKQARAVPLEDDDESGVATLPPVRPSARPPEVSAAKARKKDRKPELASLAAPAEESDTPPWTCSRLPPARTSTPGRRSWTGWASRCSRPCGPSRSKGTISGAHDRAGGDAVRGGAGAGRESRAASSPWRTTWPWRCGRRRSAWRRFRARAPWASRCRIRRRAWSRCASCSSRRSGSGLGARRAADRAGPRPRGQADRGGPGQDAAPAHRRRHGHRQVGDHQHHHHQPDLPLHRRASCGC